ncbi:MAG: DUF3619 family protein [Burkholderiaceae bacterium]
MNDNEFAYQIRQALNEAAAQLDYKTTYRLEQARAAALARHREPAADRAWSPVLQPVNGRSARNSRSGWFGGFGLAAPVVALAVGFVGIYQWQQMQATQQRISDLAAMDFAVLMDENPIGAYADKGFGALLRGETEDL